MGVFYNENTLKFIFFYRNGVFIRSVSSQGYSDYLKKYFSENENFKNIYIVPYYWGAFIVNDSKIIAEKWISTETFAPYKTRMFYGEILNDTTIVINNLGENNEKDTLHFYKFYPKPDSTNKFVK